MSVSLKQSYDIEYDGTANVARMDLFADTSGDLTGLTTVDGITLLQGSTAEDISTGDVYMMKTDGTWVKQPSQSAFANVYTKAEIDSMLYLYYTKAEADALFEWVTATITTDTLPLTFKADGSPLISWSMLGNGSQQGTPTPDNPVMPEFVGVRTANLFDYKTAYAQYLSGDDIVITPPQMTSEKQYFKSSEVGQTITISVYAKTVTSNRVFIRASIGGTNINSNTVSRNNSGTLTVTVTPTSTSDFFNLTYGDGGDYNTFNKFMLNLGSTALPYEPFGWAEKITCAGQTVPVYLGQTHTVRRIKKLVLDGTETIIEESANVYSIPLSDTVITGTGISTHFEYDAAVADGQFRIDAGKSVFGYDDTQANFAAFLAAQYAAGTPVTIWYVLATPETGITNEPLCKIGDYADELSSTDAAVTIPTSKGSNTLTVDTPIQQSEMTITGKIREVTENEQ